MITENKKQDLKKNLLFVVERCIANGKFFNRFEVPQ